MLINLPNVLTRFVPAPITIADVFFLHERGTMMALYTAFLSIGVGFGMVISGSAFLPPSTMLLATRANTASTQCYLDQSRMEDHLSSCRCTYWLRSPPRLLHLPRDGVHPRQRGFGRRAQPFTFYNNQTAYAGAKSRKDAIKKETPFPSLQKVLSIILEDIPQNSDARKFLEAFPSPTWLDFPTARSLGCSRPSSHHWLPRRRVIQRRCSL